MKKFHSPLQKIQRLQHQQLRLAELALLQARQQVADCKQDIQNLEEQSAVERQAVKQQFQTTTESVSMEALKSTFARQLVTKQKTQAGIKQLEERQQQVEAVEAEFRKLKARAQGTDDLLERQFKEHRLESFRKQQVDLEDAARSVTFVKHRATKRELES